MGEGLIAMDDVSRARREPWAEGLMPLKTISQRQPGLVEG